MQTSMSRLGWGWLTLSLTVAAVTALDMNEPLESDELIRTINNGQNTWKAGRNFDPSLTNNYIKHLLGLKKSPGGSRLPPPPPMNDDIELPSTFDARQKWPFCTHMQTVRDQGPCGSCWAVAAAAAFTDRLCVATNGTCNKQLSSENLLSCCTQCGDGCQGGDDDEAWRYFQNPGIVTGGDFKSQEGCQPYTLPTCEHHVPGTRKNCSDYGPKPTPKCRNKCYNKKYKTPYKDDMYTVRTAFTISKSIIDIKKELYTNGPLEVGFHVYGDFFSYKGGVYQHTTGDYVGDHAVKLIGWGEQADSTLYWLLANSWNTDWGDKGFFKILLGKNECGIEEDVSGAYPVV